MDSFQFKIGDIVQSKMAAIANRQAPGMVVARIMEECPGGIQRKYHVAFGHADLPYLMQDISIETYVKPTARKYPWSDDEEPPTAQEAPKAAS